jgi:hypothetical protein
MNILDFNGIWKLNLEKSDIPPITKSQVLTIKTDGFKVTMTEELTNDNDELLIVSLTGNFDGKDNPVIGTPFADTVSFRLLNQNSIEGIAKKDGRICVKENAVLLDDKNTVNVTYLIFGQDENTTEYFGYFERVKSKLNS